MNEQRHKPTDEEVAEIVAVGERLHEACEELHRNLRRDKAEAA